MRPRPVLFVIPTLDAGGMTTRFETYAGELRRRGHATTFITAPGAETERTRAASRVIEADWQALGPAGIARIVRDAVGALPGR